jgi:translation initiation factor IF-3
MFRGREVTHPERGVMILDRLAEELAELGVVEQRPTQDGRNMTMMLGPSKAVLAGKADGADHSADGAEGAVEAPAAASADGALDTSVAEASHDGEVEAAQIEVPADGAGPPSDNHDGASDAAVS